MGEPYYIDIVSNFIEKKVLSEEGKDLIKPFCMVEMLLLKISHSQTLSNDGGTSGGNCEAQDLSRTIDKLRAMPIIRCPLPF
jgi:hypothetical protein